MKPATVWIAIVLLAVGVCGLLGTAGILNSGQSIGQWWPLAIVGWALAEMAGSRRITLGGIVCSLFGFALLADVQDWANDALVWSSLALCVGVAMLVLAARQDNQDRPSLSRHAS